MPRKRRFLLNQDKRSRDAKRKRKARSLVSEDGSSAKQSSSSTDRCATFSQSQAEEVPSDASTSGSIVSEPRGMIPLNPDIYLRAFSAPSQQTAPNQEIHRIAMPRPNAHPQSSTAIEGPQQIIQDDATPLSVTESTRSADVVSPASENVQNESVEIVESPVAAENGDDTYVEVQEVAVVLPNFPAFRYNPGNEHQGARIGSMSATCPYCMAKKWPTEPPGMCCANGKVNIPLLGPPPEPLGALLTNDTPLAKEFRKKIRTYNSCFVMTSFQAHTLVELGFMPTFKVQGQIYHNIGPLTPAAEQRPQFVQIYFIDDRGQQADARLSWQIDRQSPPNRQTTLCLQDMLHEHNEHVRVFKTALEQRTPDMPDYRVVMRADRVPQANMNERLMRRPATTSPLFYPKVKKDIVTSSFPIEIIE